MCIKRKCKCYAYYLTYQCQIQDRGSQSTVRKLTYILTDTVCPSLVDFHP